VVLATIALLAVGLVVSDSVVLVSLRGTLTARLDTQLRAASTIFARLPAGLLPAQGLNGSFPGLSTSLYGDLDITYLDADGNVRSAAHAPGHGGPLLPELDSAAVAAYGDGGFEVPDAAGGPAWRVLVVPRTDGSVAVASSLSDVESTMGRIRATCVLIGLAVLAALAVAAWFAVRAGLYPLRRIERTTTAIAGGNLSQRVPEEAAPGTEVGRLSTALNGMLGQIEAAFAARAASEARMRRFVADASHELRTPLFGIIGSADLYRMGALAEPADLDRTMSRIEAEAVRLSRLVEDLLLLARFDESPGALQLAPMDLRAIAADALHDLRALDPDRPARLTGPDDGPVGPAPVVGDESRLRQVVTNLIGNVTAHTPPGTAVRVGVGTVAGHAVLEVQDHGPGLSDDQTRHVFDRFYRADSARSRTGGAGAGLGLAIAQSLVTAHGGHIDLRTAPGAGATFRILLPRREWDDG
jgi:two-component system OmpR family sensor kinase